MKCTLKHFLKNMEFQYSGESKLGVEIKYDKKLCETGNVYIEYQERMKE